MNNEQNIDDILKLLQEQVDSLGENGELSNTENTVSSDISTDDLTEKLKAHFFSEGYSDNNETDSSYHIDSDFLAEFESGDAEEAVENTVAEPIEVAEENETEEAVSDADDVSLMMSVTEGDTEAVEEIENFEEESEEIYDTVEPSDGIEEEIPELVLSHEESCSAPVVTMESEDEAHSFDGELFENDESYDDVIDRQTEIDYADTESEELAEDTEKDEEAPAFDPYAVDLPQQKPMSFKALMMDYGRPDPIPSPRAIEEETVAVEDEDETPDVGDILSDFTDDTPTAEDRVNTSMRKLMSSLGCEDELECISPEALGEIYSEVSEEQATDSEELDESVLEKNKDDYKKTVVLSSLKLTACAFMTLIMFLYDTLPMFDVEFFGILDHTLYPSAYVIIGTQLLILTAVCLWRPMLGGLKRLLTPYPNIYSMAAVLVGFNIAYDAVLFITGGYTPAEIPMFHFASGAVMLVISLTEFLMQIREARAYDMYTTDVARFTLTYDKAKHSIGEKMYSGGFSRDKKVYFPSPVSNPKGFFEAIRDEGEFDSVIYTGLVFTSVAVCALVGIVFMIVKSSLDFGAAAAMTSAVMLLPISAVVSLRAPLLLSASFLRKRGIALTGRKAVKKYGAESAIVFNDLHLFSKCEPRSVGFVCYEKLQTKNILASLQILYARIGGPMCEVFANVPDSCRAKTVRVRRITRSGIEAVVDKSHTLIVGDADFLRRYGIEFPSSEGTSDGRNATLYISLDGRASAKLTAKYSVEPVFDMLIERLARDGIHCVVETYDPMINTAFVAKQRKRGRAPISVVHKNAADINRKAGNAKKKADHGILAVSSRLKLAEAAVWCARLCKIDKISNIIIYSSMGLGFAVALTLAILGAIPCFMQYMLVLYLGAVAVGIAALALSLFPNKNYFTVKALQKEDAEKEEKIQQERKGQ